MENMTTYENRSAELKKDASNSQKKQTSTDGGGRKRSQDERDDYANCPRVLLFNPEDKDLLADIKEVDNLHLGGPPWDDKHNTLIWLEDDKDLEEAKAWIKSAYGGFVVLQGFNGRALSSPYEFEIASGFQLEQKSWRQLKEDKELEEYEHSIDEVVRDMQLELDDHSEVSL